MQKFYFALLTRIQQFLNDDKEVEIFLSDTFLLTLYHFL